MPEIEPPTQPIYEPTEAQSFAAPDTFVNRCVLTTLFLAVASAVAWLMAGHSANSALLEQTRASNKWAYYQSKSIKSSVLSAKMELMEAMGKAPAASKPKSMSKAAYEEEKGRWDQDLAKLKEYRKEMDENKKDAEERTEVSDIYMTHFVIMARAVTFFQIATALMAMAALTRRRKLWIAGLVMAGLGGLFFLGSAL